jgi:hypothetical protein
MRERGDVALDRLFMMDHCVNYSHTLPNTFTHFLGFPDALIDAASHYLHDFICK